ncbi:unnamed protein product, partial [Amoebophrya sp. A120]
NRITIKQLRQTQRQPATLLYRQLKFPHRRSRTPPAVSRLPQLFRGTNKSCALRRRVWRREIGLSHPNRTKSTGGFRRWCTRRSAPTSRRFRRSA